MVTRKEQAARSKERLLTAAKELIGKNGYDKVSIIDITGACGMSVGNFYHYFKSKEELITAIEREPFEHGVEELLEQEDKNVQELLCDYIAQWSTLAHNTYGHHFDRQWFIYHVSNPTSLDDPENKINIAIREVKACLCVGIHKGELREDTPVDILAREIALSIFGMDCYFVMTNGEFSEIEWSKEFCGTILPLLLTPYYLEK